MKKLSETYKELGIAFKFPIKIEDANGYKTYYEDSYDYCAKWERDAKGNQTYFESSTGYREGTPRPKTNRFDENGTEVYLEDGEALL